jgi:hypothetical protein
MQSWRITRIARPKSEEQMQKERFAGNYAE